MAHTSHDWQGVETMPPEESSSGSDMRPRASCDSDQPGYCCNTRHLNETETVALAFV